MGVGGLLGTLGLRSGASEIAGRRGDGGGTVTLLELSAEYRESAELLRSRLRTLRRQLRRAEEPAVCFSLQRRIAMLTELLRQTNELAELTERYYERGYWRNEKYTV